MVAQLKIAACHWGASPLRDIPWPVREDRLPGEITGFVADLYPQPVREYKVTNILRTPRIESSTDASGRRMCREMCDAEITECLADVFCAKVYLAKVREPARWTRHSRGVGSVMMVVGGGAIAAACALLGLHDVAQTSGDVIGLAGAVSVGLAAASTPSPRKGARSGVSMSMRGSTGGR